MKTVIQAIEASPTRLSIILSDCCNGPVASKLYCPELLLKTNSIFKPAALLVGAQKLFTKTSGHIRATASSPGQNALAFRRGSVFTLAFTQAVSEATAVKHPSWDRVFQSTKTKCGTLQTPYVALDLR